jgi:WD40 repeat protein
MARLWEVETARMVGEPLRHQATVMRVAFSPDGRMALTASLDHIAQLWDTATCKPIGNPFRHNTWIGALAFSPDGRSALTGSADGVIQLWDTSTYRPIGVALRHQGRVTDACFSPDGRAILSAGTDRTARIGSIPGAVEGEVRRVIVWVQLITGTELDDNDVVRILDAPTWQARRRQLEELGGSPLTP